MANINNYYDLDRTRRLIENGDHRRAVGGMWDEIGKLQFDYLVNDGLNRSDRLLDVGCGCLRGGVHFVDYLDPENYFGIDISKDLLDIGYEAEITRLNLCRKLPRKNLLVSYDFDAKSFNVQFNAVLAISLFSHLPLNHIKLCLVRLESSVRLGANFYASVFMVRDGAEWSDPLTHTSGAITTYPERDPYHYTQSDLEYSCRGLGWRLERLEDWNHPRAQLMAVFKRINHTIESTHRSANLS